MEKQIKIVRLQSGEDIIATFSENKKTKKVTLESPMHIIMKRINSKSGPMMYMVPWLPVEMVDVDMATFDSSNVLVTLEPKKDMSEYYQDLVTQSQEKIKDTEDEFFGEEWEEITDEYINTTSRKKGDMLH
jgi:uncharacterized glyoxalase superfamily protein PhnB|tara:strand:- start:773 stop:1165 length:393 start_codon:yes stop_codon:yes gene_type:complete